MNFFHAIFEECHKNEVDQISKPNIIEIIAVIACRSSFVIFDYLSLCRIRAAICWLLFLLKMTVSI